MDEAMRARCKTTLHVLTPDGAVLTGANSVLFIAQHTGFGLLAWVFRSRPALWVLEPIYRWVARNRRLVGRYLFTEE